MSWGAGTGLAGIITSTLLFLGPAQLLVAIVALGGVAFYFAYPFVSVLTFFGFRTVVDLLWWIDVEVFGLNVLQIYSGAVTGLAVFLVGAQIRKVEKTPPFPAFALFTFLVVVGFVRCADPVGSADQLVKLMSPFVLMFLVTVLFDTRDKRMLLVYVIAGMSILSVVLSLYSLATGQMNEHMHHGYNRLMGSFKNLHNHALVMMFVGTLFLFLTVQQKNAVRTAFAALVCGAAVLCMYLTYVRTAALGFLAFVMVFWTMQNRLKLLVGTLTAIVLFAGVSSAVQDRFSDFILFWQNDPMQGGRAGLGSGRWDLWTMSLQNFLERPWIDLILGLGLDGYIELTSDWLRKYNTGSARTVDPHNDFLSVLYQLGPLGLGAYISMMMTVVRTAIDTARNSLDPWEKGLAHYVIGLTATVALTNGLSNAFVQRTTIGWYYWGLAGLIFAIHLNRKSDEGEPVRKLRPVP